MPTTVTSVITRGPSVASSRKPVTHLHAQLARETGRERKPLGGAGLDHPQVACRPHD
jgi:hypothetical protein